jgi:hypothetical protein
MSREKLSPSLGYYIVDGKDAAIDLCADLLKKGGAGHTAGIHSASEATLSGVRRALTQTASPSTPHQPRRHRRPVQRDDSLPDPRLWFTGQQHHHRQRQLPQPGKHQARCTSCCPGLNSVVAAAQAPWPVIAQRDHTEHVVPWQHLPPSAPAEGEPLPDMTRLQIFRQHPPMPPAKRPSSRPLKRPDAPRNGADGSPR